MGVYDRTVEKLHEKKAEAFESMQALMETPQSEWSADDIKQWDKLDADIKQYDSDIDAERKTIDRAARMDQLRGGVHTSRGETHDASGCHTFRDASTGVEVRSLAPTESIVSNHDRREASQINPGRCLRALVLNDYSGLTPLETRALIGGSDTAGGFLLPSPISGRIIDLARSKSVTQQAGGTILPMTSGDMRVVRITSDPTSYWRPETANVAASQPVFDAINLHAKTLACIIPVSVELLEDASNIESTLMNVVSQSLALKMDQAVLAGTGASSEPEGIRNNSSVNTQSSVGTPTTYAHVTAAVKNILTDNYAGEVSGLSWIQHPRDWAILDGLADTTDQPLQPTPWARELRRFSTTSISTTEGGGSNESYAIIGDFTQCLIGLRTALNIRIGLDGTVTDGGSTVSLTSTLQRAIVAYLRMDVAVLRPDHFDVATGITIT